tara:strand:- start:437 stop:760 length:324 start_codon:yes stop_codon:yes gene_type:complete
MLTPLAWATRLLVPRCLAVPQFLQEGESTPMAFFLGDYFNKPSIMEQMVIFSGLNSFPGSVFRKNDLSALFYIGARCSLLIVYYSLPEELGIAAVDRLYPLKPKNPI